MAKKLSKTKKKVVRKPRKKSLLERIFTFPKLAAFGFVILSIFTIYQVTLASKDVRGVATTNDDMKIISKSEADAIVAAGSSSPYTVHQVDVFVDNKKTDGKWDEYSENCYSPKVSLYADNGTKVKNFDPVSGCTGPIRIRTKARTITIGIKPISGYKNTGLTYSDKTYKKRTILNSSKVKVTAWSERYPATSYLTYIQFGIKKK